ncbi:unnamed protein product [Lymnaea stagnalis]|uniref:CUB domain-containing protein n=1 Tax=Lymnaea stagnalis TaxID=6523 RepID=A0AAV2ISL5_LYMST
MRTINNSSGLYCTEYYGCNTNLRDPLGYLSSPGYPIEFPGCFWRIVTDPGSVVALRFSMEINPWYVQCGYNYVSIIDENAVEQSKIQMCLNSKGWIQTSSNVMLIVFHGHILEQDAFVFSGRYNSHSCSNFTWGSRKLP